MSTPRNGRTRRRRAIVALSLGRDGGAAASRRASTSSPARSTRRTRPRIYDKMLSRQVSAARVSASRGQTFAAARRISVKTLAGSAEPSSTLADARALPPVDGEHSVTQTSRSLRRVMIARPEFGPFVLLVVELVGLLGDQPRFPVAAEHQQHADLHGRTRPDRAGHDAADDRGRIRSLGRLGVRLRAGADVDAVQRRRHLARGRLRRRAGWSRR